MTKSGEWEGMFDETKFKLNFSENTQASEHGSYGKNDFSGFSVRPSHTETLSHEGSDSVGSRWGLRSAFLALR